MHRANIVRLLKGTENKIGSKKEPQAMNNQRMNNVNNQGNNNQGFNNQGMNNVNNQGMNNVNNQGMNNQGFNNNQMFLDPSDLVDTSDFQDDKFNGSKPTEQLYNTQFFDVSNVNASNTNSSNVADFDIQKGNNAYYRGYESCDTLDETRQLDDSELLEEANDMLNRTKSYYDK